MRKEEALNQRNSSSGRSSAPKEDATPQKPASQIGSQKPPTWGRESRQTGRTDAGVSQGASKGFERLREAIKASKALNEKNFTEAYLNKVMMDVANSFDLRGTIFAAFYRVGFDLHELSPKEKQQMEVLQLYPHLKNGEIWQDIKQELEDMNVKPTSDDKHWMDTAIEETLEQTENGRHQQNLFAEELRKKEQEDLESYYAAIRLKNTVPGKSSTAVHGSAKKTTDSRRSIGA